MGDWILRIAGICFVAFVAYLLTLAVLDYIEGIRQDREAAKWTEARARDEHRARSELYPPSEERNR